MHRQGLLKIGTAQKVTEVLDQCGFPYEIFSEVKPNPTVTNVKDGIKAFADAKADCIIAIGGGSAMDTAKGIGIVTNNPEFSDIVSLEGVAPTKKKSVPINYVIIDEERQAKMVCVDPNDIPALAHQAIADVCTPGNPRDVTEAEIIELYKKVL